MKRLILASAILINAGAALAADATTNTPAPAAAASKSSAALSSDDAKAGYALGYRYGKVSADTLPTFDVDAYVAGFRDAYAKKDAALTNDQMEAALTSLKQRLDDMAHAKMKQEADDNGKKGQAFLATNSQKPGVKTTASGLQYEVLTEGKGPKPLASDTVKVTYEGRLIDGQVFDSTAQHGGEPVSFQLDQVIPGWTEGVQLMNVGSKYRFAIPSSLGYGEQGGGPIPPNSVLVFEVELLAIEKPKSEEKPAAKAASKKKKAAE